MIWTSSTCISIRLRQTLSRSARLKNRFRLNFSGEHVALGRFAPAHTDSDIFIHFQKANVLHMGDVFFNGIYCYIDRGTNGSIRGMIAGATKMLAMFDNDTKVDPGFTVRSETRPTSESFATMLLPRGTACGKLKTSGKSLDEAIAAKPLR